MSGEAIAIIGAAVGLLGVLVPLMLYLHGRLAADLTATRAELSGDVASVRADVASVRAAVHAEATASRAAVHALAERVARIEGAMSGPWRPPSNGTPATPSTAPPEAPA